MLFPSNTLKHHEIKASNRNTTITHNYFLSLWRRLFSIVLSQLFSKKLYIFRGDWGELRRGKMWFWKPRRPLSSFHSLFWSSMKCSTVYSTPKRKFNRNTACSPSDASPVEKRAKESNSPDVTSPRGEDEVMAALNLCEGVAEKFELILAKLCSLDSKMENLNATVKSLQSKLSVM